MQGVNIFSFDGEKTSGETDADFAGYSYGLKMVRYIEDTELPAVTNNVQAFGVLLGKIFTKFFNVQVPDVQYNAWD